MNFYDKAQRVDGFRFLVSLVHVKLSINQVNFVSQDGDLSQTATSINTSRPSFPERGFPNVDPEFQ